MIDIASVETCVTFFLSFLFVFNFFSFLISFFLNFFLSLFLSFFLFLSFDLFLSFSFLLYLFIYLFLYLFLYLFSLSISFASIFFFRIHLSFFCIHLMHPSFFRFRAFTLYSPSFTFILCFALSISVTLSNIRNNYGSSAQHESKQLPFIYTVSTRGN